TIIRIKGLQILGDGRAAKRNYNDNRLAGAGIAGIQEGRQAVRGLDFLRAIARNTDEGAAVSVHWGLGSGERQSLDLCHPRENIWGGLPRMTRLSVQGRHAWEQKEDQARGDECSHRTILCCRNCAEG